jgi:transposase
MLIASHIVALHDQLTAHGHDSSIQAPSPSSPFAQLVLDQHQANYDLWHREDAARDPDASDHTIVDVKHDIDRLNQRRNDLAEQIDLNLLQLAPEHPSAPLNSESPGLIIDRLSILALKIFHTTEQLHRSTPEHQQRNQSRLLVLNEQRTDLSTCLDALWSDVLAGRRRFKLYRQLKMYNDPTLNPVLYNRSTA